MIRRYKPPDIWLGVYGEAYDCDHPVYNTCTLYLIDGKGLAVIQQRFNPGNKVSWWGPIDPWLRDDIYLNPRFLRYFRTHAQFKDGNGLYPTVTIRKLMHALRMPPMEKQEWETRFD